MTFHSRGSQFAAWNRTRQETGFRSGLEVKLGGVLETLKTWFKKILYEKVKIPYQVVSHNNYMPDWVLLPQHILIEAKGQFTPQDRQKMLQVRANHPNLDIRIVLESPNTKISKGSKTTYADWCNKHGYLWCAAKDFPPAEWLQYKPTAAAKRALKPFLPDEA